MTDKNIKFNDSLQKLIIFEADLQYLLKKKVEPKLNKSIPNYVKTIEVRIENGFENWK